MSLAKINTREINIFWDFGRNLVYTKFNNM